MSQFERHNRIAVNESRFREINDRLAEALSALRHPPDRIDFVCECANLDCREQISLVAEEYEAVRADVMHFAIAPGHEVPDAETVVDRHERFWTVRKFEDVRTVVEDTDPRSA